MNDGGIVNAELNISVKISYRLDFEVALAIVYKNILPGELFWQIAIGYKFVADNFTNFWSLGRNCMKHRRNQMLG